MVPQRWFEQAPIGFPSVMALLCLTKCFCSCVLQAKLNRGEGCLTAPFPSDVSTLIKQFCRELPEPLFPSELHAALLKAQALPSPQDRTSALQLLSCLLPARNASCLHYLLDFLFKVSQRFERKPLLGS